MGGYTHDPWGVAEDSYQIALGKRVRELRASKSLSQEELADASKITAKYLSQLENGHVNPSVGVLRALAEEGLKVSLSEFFNFSLSAGDADEVKNEVVRLLSGVPQRDREKALAALRAFCE